jgi:hypothetical protein
MPPQFKAGQTVRLRRRTNRLAIAEGSYKVIRELPSEAGGELQYRVKSLREPHERVVGESDLEKI